MVGTGRLARRVTPACLLARRFGRACHAARVLLRGSALTDRISGPHGHNHVIHLHRPDGDAPAAGHPLVWLLDAPTTWAPMQQALHEHGRAAVVIGIGWDQQGPVDPNLRRRDFTRPARHGVPPPRGRDEDWREDGDADAFGDFLGGTLQPRYLRELPVDPARQTLVGHSLSGLFVLQTLLARPRRFARYVAASPSIWWDGARLLDAAGNADWRGARAARVLVTVGSQEQAAGPEKPPGVAGEDAAEMLGEAHMVANARRFAGLLREHGVDCGFRLFQGESHHSVLPVAMAEALEFAVRSE